MPGKPRLSIEQAASDHGLNDHDAEVESWGDTLALQAVRACWYWKRLGMPVSCPPEGVVPLAPEEPPT